MKNLLLIFMVTLPSLALSMEDGAIKIYELNMLRQRYTELLPVSDGKFHKGWGQEQPGRGFIYGSGLAGKFDPSCYQPSITDITAANLLHYYQQHENKINQLLIDTAPLKDSFGSKNEILKNKMDELQAEYNVTTVRHQHYYTECQNTITRHDASHKTNIKNLRDDNNRIHGEIELHEGRINTLQQNMQDYNRATGHITQLQTGTNTHIETIAHQQNQINALQRELNFQRKASDECKEEINQFIDTTIQQHNEFKDRQINQLLKDVVLLKTALDNMSTMSYGKNNNLFTEKELLNTYNMAYVLVNSNFNPKTTVSLNRLFDLIERIRPGHQSSDPIEQNPAYFAYTQPDEEEASHDMCSKLRIVVLFNQLNRYLQENNNYHPKKDDYYQYLKNQDGRLNNGLENPGITNFKSLTLSVAKTNSRRGNHLKNLANAVIESIKSDKK